MPTKTKARVSQAKKYSTRTLRANRLIANKRVSIALAAVVMMAVIVGAGAYFRRGEAYSTNGRNGIIWLAAAQIGHREWDAQVLSYTGGVRDAWCAYFVSWVYKQAGFPMRLDNDGRVPLAWKPGVSIRSLFTEKGRFYPPGKNGGYQARQGDVVVFGEDRSHVGIVLEYVNNSSRFYLRTIEGNGPNNDVAIREYTDFVKANILGFGEAEAFIPCDKGGYKC